MIKIKRIKVKIKNLIIKISLKRKIIHQNNNKKLIKIKNKFKINNPKQNKLLIKIVRIKLHKIQNLRQLNKIKIQKPR